MKHDPLTTQYFAEASSWEQDRERQARRTLRLIAASSVLGWIAAISAAVALVVLMPLKTVEPYLVRVDSSTGVVDVVPSLNATAPQPEVVTRYLLTHYVQVCQRFNFATAESDYEECAALHTPQQNQAWAARWSRSNPASPLNAYKDGTVLRADVQSVSFFTRAAGVADLAQVRYAITKRQSGGAGEQVTHWIATIQYAYADPPTDPRVRRWNPLGFRIVDFKPEPESEPTVSEPAVAMQTATTQGGGR